jgi:uridine kinase
VGARVILLAGPSGSGKSRLAQRSGLPILQLDDFYRSGDDPELPRFPDDSATPGAVDWDDPASWHADRALTAIRMLCDSGETTVPVYDIAANGPVGTQHLGLGGADTFVAEGIFAAELVGPCRAAGLLDTAFCVRRSRWLTMVLRLRRDLAERRKPPGFLLRRGWYLARVEPAIVADLEAKGCRCRSPKQVERYLAAAADP